MSGVAPPPARTNLLRTTVKPFMIHDMRTRDPSGRPPTLTSTSSKAPASPRTPGNRRLRDSVIGACEKLDREARTVDGPHA